MWLWKDGALILLSLQMLWIKECEAHEVARKGKESDSPLEPPESNAIMPTP